MENYLDKTGLAYFWGKIKPKFYDVEFNIGASVTSLPDQPSLLAVSKTNFDKGLYMITYDVFVFSTQDTNSTCTIYLSYSEAGASVNTSQAHKIVAPMFGDLAFGTFVSYTDFIELSKPSVVSIGTMGNRVTLQIGSNTTAEEYQPTVIKLR